MTYTVERHGYQQQEYDNLRRMRNGARIAMEQAQRRGFYHQSREWFRYMLGMADKMSTAEESYPDVR